jgi:hypothetical protein
VAKPPLPPADGLAYLWWSQGALDEVRARTEDVAPSALRLIELLEGLGRGRGAGSQVTEATLATQVMQIVAPERLKRRFRRG